MIPNRNRNARKEDYFDEIHQRAVKLDREANPSAGKIIAALLILAAIVSFFLLLLNWTAAPVIDRENNVTPARWQHTTYPSARSYAGEMEGRK